MAATIKDIAKQARVSVASVSRALNGSTKVDATTRERILRVARRLRYTPHAGARSLITRRTHTVGVLLPDIHGEFFSELIRGIDRAARAHGLHLLVSSSHGDATEAAAALASMSGRVDGLLVMSPHVDADFLSDTLPPGLPSVLMNTREGSGAYPSFLVDNFGGAMAVTQHLARQRRSRIAFITGPDSNFESQERQRGYLAALASLRGKPEPIIIAGNFTEESGYLAGRQILGMRSMPDAVFAANDMMAVGCLLALTAGHVKVPEVIAIAGFDDIPIASYVAPPLTTVRVDIAEMGRRALEALAPVLADSSLRFDKSNRTETLRTTLIVRKSCGASNG